MFVKQLDHAFLPLIVYVDDVLVTETNEDDIVDVKQFLHSQFTIKDLGYAKYFLSLKITCSTSGTFVNKRKYVLDVFKDTDLLGFKPTTTPLPLGNKFSTTIGSLLFNPDRYKRIVGRFLYLGFTRLDITYVTQQLSQFVHALCQVHWDATLHVLRYLKVVPLKDYFSLMVILLSFNLIVMLIGSPTLILESLLLVIVFSLD